MKYVIFGFFFTFIAVVQSCKKDGFITNADAVVYLSEDTLHFDTVFTSTGSTTQLFKIFNAKGFNSILLIYLFVHP
jgi:hypothetical protein